MVRLLTVTPCGIGPCAPARVERYCSRAAAGESVTQAGRLAAAMRLRRFWDSGSSAMGSLYLVAGRFSAIWPGIRVKLGHDVRTRQRRGRGGSAIVVAPHLVVASHLPARASHCECCSAGLAPPPGLGLVGAHPRGSAP